MFTSQVDTSVDLEEEKDQLRADGTKKDRYKSLIHVIRDHLYPCERHFYTTKDNYINCVFRISGQRGTTAEENANARLADGYRPKPVMLY